MTSMFKYNYTKDVRIEDAIEKLTLAINAVDELLGYSTSDFTVSLIFNDGDITCMFEAMTEYGCAVAKVYNGFLLRAFGSSAFTVKKFVEFTAGNEESVKAGALK